MNLVFNDLTAAWNLTNDGVLISDAIFARGQDIMNRFKPRKQLATLFERAALFGMPPNSGKVFFSMLFPEDFAAGTDRNPCSPALRHAAPARRADRGGYRPADGTRQGQGAGIEADGPARRQHRYLHRNPCHFPGIGILPQSGAGRDRRTASLRRRPAADAHAQGPRDAALPGDDGDPDPAHAHARPIW